MDANLFEVLNADIIHDELSLEDIKGGLVSDHDKAECCNGGNHACNINTK